MDAIHRGGGQRGFVPEAGGPEHTGKGITAETDSVCRRNVLGCSLTGCVLSLFKVVALLAGFS